MKLDKSNPTANLSITAGTLGTDGWYIDDVTVHASGADNVSDPTTCAPLNQQQTTDTVGQQFTADCTNDAGRTQAATPVTIKRDASAPTAHLEVVSGTPGANGWYTSAVTVRTVGADATSGVTCSTDQVLDTETAGTTVTGYCMNGAGTRTDAAPLTVKIDTTGPTAVAAVSAGTLGADGWYTTDVTVHTTGGDSISGPVTCDADQHQTAETTGKDFTGTCTNAAGLSTVSPAVDGQARQDRPVRRADAERNPRAQRLVHLRRDHQHLRPGRDLAAESPAPPTSTRPARPPAPPSTAPAPTRPA